MVFPVNEKSGLRVSRVPCRVVPKKGPEKDNADYTENSAKIYLPNILLSASPISISDHSSSVIGSLKSYSTEPVDT